MHLARKPTSVELGPIWRDQDWGLLLQPMTQIKAEEWACANRDELQALLTEYGALLFRGFPIESASAFEGFIEQILPSPFVPYREASTPRTRVSGNVFTSTEYPREFDIYLHNENSHVTSWPMYLCFQCRVEPASGGRTPLANCNRIYDRLPNYLIKAFSEKGWLYRRNFFDHSAISWKSAFGVSTASELEKYCLENRLTPEWNELGLSIQYRRWAVVNHPELNVPVWFNHGLFFNPFSLAEELREAMAELSDDELASCTYFGDGSPVSAASLAEIDTAYRSEMVSFEWRTSDILILDNMRIAHGRQAYAGKRDIVVSMKNQVQSQDLPDCQRFL